MLHLKKKEANIFENDKDRPKDRERERKRGALQIYTDKIRRDINCKSDLAFKKKSTRM